MQFVCCNADISPPDPRSESFPLVSTPFMLAIIGIYLYFVLSVGPRFMEKRKPFQIKNILIAYNSFQIISNVYVWFYVSTASGIHFLSPQHDDSLKRTECIFATNSFRFCIGHTIRGHLTGDAIQLRIQRIVPYWHRIKFMRRISTIYWKYLISLTRWAYLFLFYSFICGECIQVIINILRVTFPIGIGRFSSFCVNVSHTYRSCMSTITARWCLPFG